GDTTDSKAIGAKLGVATLLEGTVRRDGERVRIVVELVNAANGSSLWSQVYDRELKDIFDVQSDIARSIAGAMQIKLQGAAAPNDDKPPGGNLDAYGAFLQGGFFAARGGEEDDRRAIEYYQRAVKIDPEYALAYARLGKTLISHAAQYLGGEESAQAYARARAAVGRALSLAPDMAESHIARGALLNTVNFDQAGAVKEFRHALQLAPNNLDAKAALALQLATLGELRDAEALLQQALSNDPLRTTWLVQLATYLVPLGRLDDAEHAIRRAIALQPNASYNHVVLTIIEIRRNVPAAAMQAAQAEPRGPWQDYAMALAKYAAGDSAGANAALQELIRRYADAAPFQIASAYAMRKDPDAAFQWLDRAWKARDPGVSTLLYDPFLLAYRNDPRFAALCAKAGLPPPAREPAD
ncbi:MAG TPA: tetratricopeptide repeat protein, partial [Rhodanobacteraceae bacterium]|nr:tetratricopeptide repeat protein [Rhodanobacteraceae bacterium]